MHIISFDQASIKSGWALFENNNYIDSGIISKDNKISIDQRVPQMAEAICAKIKSAEPDIVCIEGIQTQSNQSTVIDLARLQGGIMMWCDIKKIPLHILTPTQWRKILGYQQGPKVKRTELKSQSLIYVKDQLGLAIESIDECEAICINIAAQKLWGV